MVTQDGTEKKSTKLILLEAGIVVMTRKSYNGAGLTEILTEAGVPKGSFYHYFRSKEDFGVQIVEHHAKESGEILRQYLENAAQTPMTRIRCWFSYLGNHYREHGPEHECLIAKLALELSTLSAPMLSAVKYAYDYWTQIFAQSLIEAQQQGELDPELDANKLATFVINSWQGVTIRMQIDGSLEPLENFLEVLFSTLLKAPDSTP